MYAICKHTLELKLLLMLLCPGSRYQHCLFSEILMMIIPDMTLRVAQVYASPYAPYALCVFGALTNMGHGIERL